VHGAVDEALERETLSTVVFVEGVSDRGAVEALADRHGRDLAAENVSVLPMGGAQAIWRFLAQYGPAGLDVRLAGLCDAGEERQFRRAFERAGVEPLAVFVCNADLEDELIRALGSERVLQVVEAEGDLRAFRTLQNEPAWRGRPVEAQLRRFMGSGGRRKTRYAPLFVRALELNEIPRPLEGLLAHL
jgi:hypothetical protein